MFENYNVAVLMSTYNGEKYLKEQIESIFAQNGVNVTLFVRDDGSKDDTIHILETLSELYNIQLINGENIGWRKSFMELVRIVPDSFSYYAFSDQDDVWLPDKLSSSISILEKSNGPALCCSTQTLVDENLLVLQEEIHLIPSNYREAMTNISCRGCTEVFNNSLLSMLQKYMPSTPFAHDRWIARVANFLGDIYFDSTSHILYRQHETNTAGNNFNVGIRDRTRRALKNYETKDFYYWYAKELLSGFDADIDAEKKEYLQLLVASKHSVKSKLKLLISKDFVSESFVGTSLLKLVMLFGVYQR